MVPTSIAILPDPSAPPPIASPTPLVTSSPPVSVSVSVSAAAFATAACLPHHMTLRSPTSSTTPMPISLTNQRPSPLQSSSSSSLTPNNSQSESINASPHLQTPGKSNAPNLTSPNPRIKPVAANNVLEPPPYRFSKHRALNSLHTSHRHLRSRHTTRSEDPQLHHHPRRTTKIKARTRDPHTAPPDFPPSTTCNIAPTLTDTIPWDPPVTSYWGTEPVPLPSRFTRLKQSLISGHEPALSASWTRLLHALHSEITHIENLGMHLIPSIAFSDLSSPSQATRFAASLRRYGVAVVRGVLSREEADSEVAATMEYVEGKPQIKAIPTDRTCYDFYWSPAQIRMRAHPRVLEAQKFMMGLWGAPGEARLVPGLPISYADRVRIHGSRMAEEKTHAVANAVTAEGEAAAASVDDWLAQLHSSGGIIVQVDNGSLERWEPDGYHCTNSSIPPPSSTSNSAAGSGSSPPPQGTYDSIFRGNWESYDPWECAPRVSASPDLYNGHGACSMFRMYQGMLALSTIEPGIIRFLPSPKLAVAYLLLRPFFSPKTPVPAVREGPEWEAFLDADNWRLDVEQSSVVHGAVPGHAQRLTELWHPHLRLRRSIVTLPMLQAGDYMFWHPDVAYHVSSNFGRESEDSSVLMYIPAAPLTQTNALYLARQRKAFQRGTAPPDFDSSGSRVGSEAPDGKRLGEEDVAEFGPVALRAMGLAPWEIPKVEDVGAEITETEMEVVKLANMILFPDTCI